MSLDALYQEIILEHNRKPRNFREMPDANRRVEGHNPLCGDQVTLWLRLDGERVADASFQGLGCAISKASASMMTAAVKGKTVAEALEIKNTDIVKELALPPVKIHCSVLAEDAIRAAISDWKKKNGVAETEAVAAQ